MTRRVVLKALIRWQPLRWVEKVCAKLKMRCCDCLEVTERMKARAVAEGRSGEGCGAGCDLCYTSRQAREEPIQSLLNFDAAIKAIAEKTRSTGTVTKK